MNHVLIVVDDLDLADQITSHLLREGFGMCHSPVGSSAFPLIVREQPDLVLVGLGMEHQAGLELVGRLTTDPLTESIPVIVLGSRFLSGDGIEALERGAADYLPYPFVPRELVLRIAAALRHASGEPASAVPTEVTHPFRLDPFSLRLQTPSGVVKLTRTEVRMMSALLDAEGGTVPRGALQQSVWGLDAGTESRSLDTHLKRLREKLGPYGRGLQTIRGRGFRFAADEACMTSCDADAVA